MLINKIINKEIDKIFDLKSVQTISNVDKLITNYFINKWKTKKKLPSLRTISKQLSISESSISKYLSKNKIEKFLVLQYIFKINSITKNKTNINFNKNIQEIAKKIKKSNKVIFLAQGISGLISRFFYTLLVLKNINAIYVEGKPDQMKLLENYDKDDFIIIISHSFNHKWCYETLESNKNALFITSKEIKCNANQYLFHTYDTNNLKSEKITFFHINLINEYMQKIIDLL